MKLVGPSEIRGKEVGKSIRARVKSSTYSPKVFEIEVTWTQFRRLLRAAADKYGIDRYGDADRFTARQLFGSKWEDPASTTHVLSWMNFTRGLPRVSALRV